MYSTKTNVSSLRFLMDLFTVDGETPDLQNCLWIPVCHFFVRTELSTVHSSVPTQSYLTSFDWLKALRIKSKRTCISEKIKMHTASGRVWLGAVEIALERSGGKQMLSDDHPGFFLFEKLWSNKAHTRQRRSRRAFHMNKRLMDSQTQAVFLIFKLNLSPRIKA